MAKDQPESAPLASARLDLSSPDGELREISLVLDDISEERFSAPTLLPADIWNKCYEWHQHLEAWWEIRGEAAVKVWRRKHGQIVDEIKGIISAALLPGKIRERLTEAVNVHSSRLFLLEICPDSEQLDSIPLELLGEPDRRRGAQMVVWRRQTGPIRRNPSLRLLITRSAPGDVSLPQNEDEVRAIGTYVASRRSPGVATELLSNSTYEDFVIATEDFSPGVIHLATHGTRKAFQFNSPPSHDPIGYDSLVRYFARHESVATVISTACFSAQPTTLGENRNICLASKLVEAGLSAAIGMTNKITPNAAKVFTEALYTELAKARPVVEAYAEAILAIRSMAEDDRLLWSVPVMYSKNGNVIPFPDQGYLDLLDSLQNTLEGIEDLRRRLNRLPMMSQGDRIAEAGGLSLDMAAIRQDLSDLEATELPGRPGTPAWRKRFRASSRRLDWFMNQVAGAVRQGQTAQQANSMLTVALDEVEQLIADRYAIAVDR